MYNIYLTKLGNIGVGTLYLGTGAGLDVAGWGFLKNSNIKQPKLLDMTIEMNEARVIWEWIYISVHNYWAHWFSGDLFFQAHFTSSKPKSILITTINFVFNHLWVIYNCPWRLEVKNSLYSGVQNYWACFLLLIKLTKKLYYIQDYLYSAFHETIVENFWQNLVNSVYSMRGWHHLFSGVRSSRII